MEKRIYDLTVRIPSLGFLSVIVEDKDGNQVFQHRIDVDGDVDETAIMKTIELLLDFLGYEADRYRLYLDDSLLVMGFTKKCTGEHDWEFPVYANGGIRTCSKCNSTEEFKCGAWKKI